MAGDSPTAAPQVLEPRRLATTSRIGRARHATGLSVPHLLQHFGFKLLPRGDREAAVNWVFGRCHSPKRHRSSGTLCVGRASPGEAQHTAAAAAKLLWAAKANAGVRNKPRPTANGPLSLGKEPCRGPPACDTPLTDWATAAALVCELGLSVPTAQGQLPLKASTLLPPWLLDSAGHSCALVPGRGVKGQPSPHAAFAVFTSHPATLLRKVVPAPLSQPARLLNPQEQGRGDRGRPASTCYQAFPCQQTGTGNGQHLNGDQAAPLGLPKAGDTPETSRKGEQAAACMILTLGPTLC